MGCGTGLMKTILIIFNVIFLISTAYWVDTGSIHSVSTQYRPDIGQIVGLVAIGLGAWLIISSDELFKFLEYDPEVGTQLLKASAYVFIACGCIVVLLSIFGICGACMRNNCMLGTYSAIMIIILIAEIAAIVMVVVYTNKFEDDFKGTLTTYLQEHFNENTEENKAFKEATVKMQAEFACCGITGPDDYLSASPPIITTSCKLNIKGCFDKFKYEFTRHKGVIIGVACGILAFEFILIVFAICLCRSKKNKNYGI